MVNLELDEVEVGIPGLYSCNKRLYFITMTAALSVKVIPGNGLVRKSRRR